MIDHLIGRPSPSWKRTQVFLVIFFWLWRMLRGNPNAPRFLWLRRANRTLKRFTPWQLIVSTLTGVYAVRNLDKILGLGSPEPLAHLYSPSYYRATWINTGLDAGFATAMAIRPKWLRDFCSVLFSVYYIVYAHEADEKLRRFRAVPTVEMLRTTWEKTRNPYIRFVGHLTLPRTSIRRKILLPRPKSSTYQRPITAYLFFAPPEEQLSRATELILDFPGGGFVSLNPEDHEDRLRIWAARTGRPILSVEYGKSPEYPYPFAIDEAFDIYRLLVDSVGSAIGMSGRKLNVILTGDSAGATLAVSVVIKILEHNTSTATTVPPHSIPLPLSLVLNYAALDFNFTSWMSPANLRVLRSEQSSGNLPGIKELTMQKDHLGHVSPLSMVGDKRPGRHGKSKLKRRSSWKDTLRVLTNSGEEQKEMPGARSRTETMRLATSMPSSSSRPYAERCERAQTLPYPEDRGALADAESEDQEDLEIDFRHLREEDKPLQARVRHIYPRTLPLNGSPLPTSPSTLEQQQERLSAAIADADSKGREKGKGQQDEPIGTRLTMTSRTGYFQDRIISPSMMRAMAILYIGPHRNPDFATDYRISPILAPSRLLAQFPPLLMQCGEKDPFVDDTVIFAGRIREAKRARKVELDLAIAGKSARFGEGLRMSTGTSESSAPAEGARLVAMKKERDLLAQQTEEDWVQMVLFSDWSHGYLQMAALMSEAKAVIEDLGDWMDGVFWRRGQELESSGGNTNGHAIRAEPSPFNSETETDDSTITFVPKKFRSSSHSSSATIGGGVINTLGDDQTFASMAEGNGFHRDDVGQTKLRSKDSEPLLINGDSADAKGQQRGTPPSGRGTKAAGQTISETELMRRRRLLDSHIFD